MHHQDHATQLVDCSNIKNIWSSLIKKGDTG